MILIEILDESGINFYEILGIDPKELAGADDKTASRLVRERSGKAKTDLHKRALKGDTEAEKMESRINEIATKLKDPKERAEYDKELESGHGSSQEVLRVQPIAPPFYWNRNARFRAIERLMTQAGLLQPIVIDEGGSNRPDGHGKTYYEILGIDPKEMLGMDDLTAQKFIRRFYRERSNAIKTELHKRAVKGDSEAEQLEREIDNIFEYLADPENRAEYNRKLNLA